MGDGKKKNLRIRDIDVNLDPNISKVNLEYHLHISNHISKVHHLSRESGIGEPNEHREPALADSAVRSNRKNNNLVLKNF